MDFFLQMKTTNSDAAVNSEQHVLRIEVTDDPNDPFFLHILQVTEGEFFRLKQDQTLLVDFHTFPIHLMELLNCCLGIHGEQQQIASSFDIEDGDSSIKGSLGKCRPIGQTPQRYVLL